MYSQYAGDSYQELYYKSREYNMGKRRDEEPLRVCIRNESPSSSFTLFFIVLFQPTAAADSSRLCFPYHSFSFFFSYSPDYYHLDIPAAFDGKWSSWWLCVCVWELSFLFRPPRAPRPNYIIYEFSTIDASIYSWIWNVLFFIMHGIYNKEAEIIRLSPRSLYNWSQQHRVGLYSIYLEYSLIFIDDQNGGLAERI